MTTPQHDPARDAASYLDGGLPAAARADFEAHILACDLCWAEVSEARTGRALAEALREAAPQALRERLRAIAATEPEPAGAVADLGVAGRRACFRRPRLSATAGRIVAAAATIAAVGMGTVLLIPGSENVEAPLFAAATVFQADPLDARPAVDEPPVGRIGAMTWRGTVAQSLAGQPALVHRYADAAGHRVILVSSTEQFPRAANAQAVDPMGKNWIAAIGGAQMLCVDIDGLSWLVISDSRTEALAAGRAAGLT